MFENRRFYEISKLYIIAFAGVISLLMLGYLCLEFVYRNYYWKNGMGSGFCCLRL